MSFVCISHQNQTSMFDFPSWLQCNKNLWQVQDELKIKIKKNIIIYSI